MIPQKERLFGRWQKGPSSGRLGPPHGATRVGIPPMAYTLWEVSAMDMIDLLQKKKRGERLSREEIAYFVQGVTDGSIPDYQISAFTMAVCLRGMDEEETANLTYFMAQSGDTVDLSGIRGVVADKHSTGGVGDTPPSYWCPWWLACGVKVAKMSGRGLGHTRRHAG